MNEILAKQLAIDFCTDVNSILSKENVFTEYKQLEGRRIFKEGECYFKAASVNGKIVASGRKDIIQWAREKFKTENGAWFMDMGCLHKVEEGLLRFQCRIGQAHPFYIATEKSDVDTKDYDIKIFIFDGFPKDEIGIGAYKDGRLLGMAGATSDSDRMWQIGINVMPEAEGLGIGTMLVVAIKNEILDKNRLPFYGTAMSHIASQRVALGAGFVPAWSELYCEAIRSYYFEFHSGFIIVWYLHAYDLKHLTDSGY